MLLGVIAKGSKVAVAVWETLVSVQRNRTLIKKKIAVTMNDLSDLYVALLCASTT